MLKKQQKQTIVSQSKGKEFNSHSTGLGHQHGCCFIRELQQQRRQQQRKRHLKCEVALFQSLLCLCDVVQFVKCWQIFLPPVVQPLDSTIHRIKSILRITQLVSLILIRLMVIYPVDSAIQILNNQGLELNSKRLYQRKKKVVVHSLFTSFTKREIRNFHVEVAW